MDGLSHTLWVRHSLTEKEQLELASQMAQAEAAIRGKQDELKSVSSTIKADMDVQMGILHKCAEQLRAGYRVEVKDCDTKYEKGIVKYVDKDTGEILESRPMTEAEQMELTMKQRDAEILIRQSTAEEDD